MSQEQEAIILHLEKRLDAKDRTIQSLHMQRDALIDLVGFMADKLEHHGENIAAFRAKLAEVRQIMGHAEVL